MSLIPSAPLKLVRCPRSLAPTLVALPSMSLIPSAPFPHVLLRLLHFNGCKSCVITGFVPQSRGYGGASMVVQAPTGSGKTYHLRPALSEPENSGGVHCPDPAH